MNMTHWVKTKTKGRRIFISGGAAIPQGTMKEGVFTLGVGYEW